MKVELLNKEGDFVKLMTCIFLAFIAQATLADRYLGCKDPKYVSYVKARLEFYDRLEKEGYEKDKKELEGNSFQDLSEADKQLFLFGNTVSSAKFDSKEAALRNIKRYEDLNSGKPDLFKSGDVHHLTNIARGWIALREGDEKKAVQFLLASADTKGSPVLGSFGPDKTLIRSLYQRGRKEAVLEYLKLAESFWLIEHSKEYLEVWRKMIANDCPIQFQFYDTTSINELGLK